ncbi:MAG TPA: hypothetical protein VFK06_08810 [Candidatus Angelobacter sp.]|nr:hypothetical protein [Candidatus Angelobacter sp.]
MSFRARTPTVLNLCRPQQIESGQTISSIFQSVPNAASGGSFNGGQAQQLTLLFTNLAQLAIKAAHDASGQEITPESVLKLMPSAAPLAQAD